MVEAELAEHGADLEALTGPRSPRPPQTAEDQQAPAPSRADVGTRRRRRRRTSDGERATRGRASASDAARSPRSAVSATAEPQERQRGAVIGFLVSCWAELKRVQWPDRETLIQASAVTLLFIAVAAAYLGALDAAFNWLVQHHPRDASDERRATSDEPLMFRWYVINTYSGHENKVKQNLEHRIETMGQRQRVRQVVVPTEQVSELKDGQRVQIEKRTMPGYVLVQMEMTDDAWNLVKNTPGVTGFVGSRNKPIPLSQPEVDRLLHRETAERPRSRAQFTVGRRSR